MNFTDYLNESAGDKPERNDYNVENIPNKYLPK